MVLWDGTPAASHHIMREPSAWWRDHPWWRRALAGRLDVAARALKRDLADWLNLSHQRRELAEQSEAAGLTWVAQAERQGLPIDGRGLKLHMRCAAFIAKHKVRRGVATWHSDGLNCADVPDSWDDFAASRRVPRGVARRAVISDALSFPLTAALALRVANVVDERSVPAELSLLVLGAEAGAELGGWSKWFELLWVTGSTDATLTFVGPRVPKALDGTRRVLTETGGRRLRLLFVRG